MNMSCTGTLVAPNVVATAEHCVGHKGSSTFSPSTMTFKLGDMASVYPKRTVAVSEIAVEEKATSSRGFISLGADVALLRLSESVTGGVLAEPRQLGESRARFKKSQRRWVELPEARGAQTSLLALGTNVFAVVGFGQRVRVRSAAMTSIKELGYLLHESDAQKPSQYQEIWMAFGSGWACHGDSGGPLFTEEYDVVHKTNVPISFGVRSAGHVNGVSTPSDKSTNSAGKQCGDPTVPNVYRAFTNPVRKFIDDTLVGSKVPVINWKSRAASF